MATLKWLDPVADNVANITQINGQSDSISIDFVLNFLPSSPSFAKIYPFAPISVCFAHFAPISWTLQETVSAAEAPVPRERDATPDIVRSSALYRSIKI